MLSLIRTCSLPFLHIIVACHYTVKESLRSNLGNLPSFSSSHMEKPTLRVVPFSLSPSCVTRKKSVGKKWPREVLLAPQDFTRPFYFAVFFRVTHNRLSERGTTRSLGKTQFTRYAHLTCLKVKSGFIKLAQLLTCMLQSGE